MKRSLEIPGIDQIVSRQVSLWRQEMRKRSGAETAAIPGPFVTISRQIGAGGRALGERVSKRLGWKLYDRSLLMELAERIDTSPEALEKLESGPHNALHDAIVLTLNHNYPGHHGYLKALIATVAQLGNDGRAVILGRGAHYLLPARYGARIRLVAPLDERLDRIAALLDKPFDDAARWIQEAESNQDSLIRNILHKDQNDPFAYDVVINTGEMDLEAAEEITLAVLRGKRLIDHV